MAKISKYLKLIVVIFALSLSLAGNVYAEENTTPDERPTEKLVHNPTPPPPSFLSPLAKAEEFFSKDTRSWTRFKYNAIIQKVAS